MTAAADVARTRRPAVLAWIAAAVAVVALGVVLWSALTEWGGIVHGQPLYAVLLALTAVVAIVALLLVLRPRARRPGVWRTIGRVVLIVLAAGWIALLVWARPHTAVEPALTAMESDAAVTVAESPSDIVLTPAGGADATGVFFQPGALVDARAYAAVLRPLAEAGHTVVIVKQPLGIAFLALGGFDAAREGHPAVTSWVVGGHSLGGTVAAIEADAADRDSTAPAVGLLFYASYPATDISRSLTIPVASISGSRDGLATPAKIRASRADLPADTAFTVIPGASHAQFGDYGPQPGDGTPTISHADARRQISAASVAFVAQVAR